LTAAQIKDASRRIQRERVEVPLLGRGGQSAIGLDQALDGRYRFRARDRDLELGLAALAGNLLADELEKIAAH